MRYHVTFAEEINELVEGDAGIPSGHYTEKQAMNEAKQYLKEETHLSGVIATFHDIKLYEQGRYDEAELFSRLAE